jgi:hypothetical protein
VKEFGRDVPIEAASGIRRGNFADAKAGEKAEHGESKKDDARPDLAAVKILGRKPQRERR